MNNNFTTSKCGRFIYTTGRSILASLGQEDLERRSIEPSFKTADGVSIGDLRGLRNEEYFDTILNRLKLQLPFLNCVYIVPMKGIVLDVTVTRIETDANNYVTFILVDGEGNEIKETRLNRVLKLESFLTAQNTHLVRVVNKLDKEAYDLNVIVKFVKGLFGLEFLKNISTPVVVKHEVDGE